MANKAATCLYALKTLKAHGLQGQALRDVTPAMAQLLYASWSGFIKSEEKAKLQSVLNKTARYGFLPEWSPKTIDELLESSVQSSSKNPDHVIHPLLPPPKPPGYNWRKRSHVLLLPPPNLTSSARILYIVCYLKRFIYMFYTLHVVMRYDSVLSKETNEWMNEVMWTVAKGQPRNSYRGFKAF